MLHPGKGGLEYESESHLILIKVDEETGIVFHVVKEFSCLDRALFLGQSKLALKIVENGIGV